MPRGYAFVDFRKGETNSVDALMGYTSRQPDGCILWTGAKTRSGYGKVTVNFRSYGAHRFFYESLVGKVPDGLQLDHLCRNRLCVNVKHLEAVTAKVNTLRGDGPTAVNARKEECLRGHAFTPENTYYAKNPPGRVCRACRAAWQRSRRLTYGR